MSSLQYQPNGWHYLVELFDCQAERMDDLAFVLDCLQEAARRGGTHVVDIVSHRFEPTGITAVALLKESHLSIHCWPEANYAAADLFTCGQHGTPQAACDYLITAFEARRHQVQAISRGK